MPKTHEQLTAWPCHCSLSHRGGYKGPGKWGDDKQVTKLEGWFKWRVRAQALEFMSPDRQYSLPIHSQYLEHTCHTLPIAALPGTFTPPV